MSEIISNFAKRMNSMVHKQVVNNVADTTLAFQGAELLEEQAFMELYAEAYEAGDLLVRKVVEDLGATPNLLMGFNQDTQQIQVAHDNRWFPTKEALAAALIKTAMAIYTDYAASPDEDQLGAVCGLAQRLMAGADRGNRFEGYFGVTGLEC